MTLAPVAPIRIGPTEKPARTLGWDVLEWTRQYLEQPDGPTAGEPWRFTREQALFVLNWYAVDASGRFVYRRGMLRRMKGWGKDPVAAAMSVVEFVGPCRFGGWRSDGDPLVIPHPASWVQIAAVSRDQTRNTMTLFPGMISKRAQEQFGIDIGKEIIYADGGRSRIEAVTSSPRSLEGGRATATVKGETHHWLANNEGLAMSDVIARNAAKSRDGSSRVLAISNAHDPREDSDAARDWLAYLEMRERGSGDFLYDSLEAPPLDSFDDDGALRDALLAARGDSEWLDIDRLMAEMRDPRTSPSMARRFYLNQIVTGWDNAWIAPASWEECAEEREVPDGALVVLGFDGSRFRDATALVGTEVESGYQWVIAVWENDGTPGWEVSRDDVDMAVDEAFSRYDVWRMYADPYWWEDTISTWAGRYGEKKVAEWRTASGGRLMAVARAVKAYETAVRARELPHEPSAKFAEHVGNARKHETNFRDEDGELLYTISKAGKNSPDKIDIAMAAVLSWEARNDALAAGATNASDWILR